MVANMYLSHLFWVGFLLSKFSEPHLFHPRLLTVTEALLTAPPPPLSPTNTGQNINILPKYLIPECFFLSAKKTRNANFVNNSAVRDTGFRKKK